jgi:hypothetical protein
MSFTPQIDTSEISDADLDNISGGSSPSPESVVAIGDDALRQPPALS